MLGTILELWPAVVGGAVGIWFPLAYLRTAWQAHHEPAGKDRAGLVDGFLVALLALLLSWLWIPWQYVPPALWAVLVAVVAYAVLLSAAAWRELPWAAGRPRRQLANTVVGGAVVAGIFAAVLW
jgi:hypothetical protein